MMRNNRWLQQLAARVSRALFRRTPVLPKRLNRRRRRRRSRSLLPLSHIALASETLEPRQMLSGNPPYYDPITDPDLTTSEDSGTQYVTVSGITSNDTPTQPMRLEVSALGAQDILDFGGGVFPVTSGTTQDFTYTPLPNQSGDVEVIVRLVDSGLDHDLDDAEDNEFYETTITIHVLPQNDDPTVDPIIDQWVPQDAPPTDISVTGLGPGGGLDEETQVLTITPTWTSNPPGLISSFDETYISPATTGTITFQPAPGLYGEADVTLTVRDGQGGEAETTFTIHVVPIADYGDAPAPYPVEPWGENVALHLDAGPMLGSLRDVEIGAHSADASGDGADEDGVQFGPIRAGDPSAYLTVDVSNVSETAYVDAWIDFVGDGTWGSTDRLYEEKIVVSAPVQNGSHTFRYAVPSWAASGTSYARVRVSSAGGLGPRGQADDGEVEDYQVEILAPVPTNLNFWAPETVSEALGTPATQAVVEDFDGDGQKDIVVGYENDTQTDLYLHTLGETGDVPPRLIVQNIVPASSFDENRLSDPIDVDQDGDWDLIVNTYRDGNYGVLWLENDGGGNFTEHVFPDTFGNISLQFQQVDFDGDGIQDLIGLGGNSSVHPAGEDVWFFKNDGSENFTVTDIVGYAGTDNYPNIALADFDGDADPDLAWNSGGVHQWWENSGDGTGQTLSLSQLTGEVNKPVLADMDGDTDLDAVGLTSGGFVYLENNGNGSFTTYEIDADHNDSFCLEDLGSDGDLDVILSDTGYGVAWYENRGGGDFIAREVADGPAADHYQSVGAGDVDDDGDLDLWTVSTYNVKVWLNDGSENFSPENVNALAADPGGGSRVVRPTDIDRDGDLDVVVLDADADRIDWYENQGDESFVWHRIATKDFDQTSIRIVDYNRDGHLDVVGTTPGYFDADQDGRNDTYYAISWNGDGAGEFSLRFTYLYEDLFTWPDESHFHPDANYQLPGVDIDMVSGWDLWSDQADTKYSGSHFGDPWSGSHGGGSGSFLPVGLRQPDGSYDWLSDLSPSFDASEKLYLDFDRDGDLDVLGVFSGTIGWLEHDGQLGFTKHNIATGSKFGVGDLDGDGDLDIYNYSDWYEAQPDMSFVEHPFGVTISSSSSLQTVDFDGDGDADIMTEAYASGERIWLKNDGAGNFTQELLTDTIAPTSSHPAHLVDANRDGTLDWIRSSDYALEWHPNPINPPPTLDPLSPLVLSEDDPEQDVALTGITSGLDDVPQELRVTAWSNNQQLFPDATLNIDYVSAAATGTLRFAPQPDAFGAATITVQVEDEGPDGDINAAADNGFVTQELSITVTEVNDPPTIAILEDLTLPVDAGEQIYHLLGLNLGTGEAGGIYAIAAGSDNPALIPTIGPVGSNDALIFTPAAGQLGTATITFTVEDAGLDGDPSTRGDNAIGSFEFDVNVIDPWSPSPDTNVATLDPIPDPPRIEQDAALQTVVLSGVSPGAGETGSVWVEATSSNAAFIPDPWYDYDSPHQITYRPETGVVGTATITVQSEDAGDDDCLNTRSDNRVSTPQSFDVIIDGPPVMEDQVFSVAENSPDGTVIGTLAATDPNGDSISYSITVNDGDSGAAFRIEGDQLLVNNPDDLDFETDPQLAITVEASDGGLTDTAQITIDLTDVPEAPTLSPIDDMEIGDSSGEHAVSLSGITAGGGESQTLQVTATSSNPGLIPNPQVNYTSPNTGGSLVFSPVLLQDGTATITVTVEDAGPDGNLATTADNQSVSETFDVVVTMVDQHPPVFDNQSLSITENSPGGTSVGTLEATDLDGDLITYSIISNTDPDGDGNNAFYLSGDELKVFDPGDLDFETDPQLTITVGATDVGGSGQSNTAQVTVDVLNTAENDSGTVTIEVQWSDPAGIFTLTEKEIIADHVKAAGYHWTGHFDLFGGPDSTIEVLIEAEDAPGTLASAMSVTTAPLLHWNGSRDHEGAAFEIITGADPNDPGFGGNHDVEININPLRDGLNAPSNKWFFEPDPWFPTGLIPGLPNEANEEYDLMSTLLHEWGHALGFNGSWLPFDTVAGQFTDQGDIYALNLGRYPNVGAFDRWLDVPEFGNEYWYFAGINAQNEYGGPVPLYSPFPTNSSGIYHLGNPESFEPGYDLSTEGELSDLMYAFGGSSPPALSISSLDLAILEDLGYPIQHIGISDHTFNWDEHSPVGTYGKFVAHDPEDHPLSISITDGNLDIDGDGNLAFRIEDHRVVVNDQQDIDYETSPMIVLELTATDGEVDIFGNPYSSTGYITIYLSDIDETLTFDNQVFNIAENSPNGSIIGTFGGDSPAGYPITYTLTTVTHDINADGNVAYEIVGNQLIVHDVYDFNYELFNTMVLSIEASTTSHEGTLTDSAQITVNITDVDDDDFLFSVYENSAEGTFVGFLPASNATYSFSTLVDRDGDGNAAFSLYKSDRNALTYIFVNDPDDLDYEDSGTYHRIFNPYQASDGSVPEGATIFVELLDVRETPIFDYEAFTIAENPAEGGVVGWFSDIDATYTIIGNNPDSDADSNAAFRIVKSDRNSVSYLIVNDADEFNYETVPVFNLFVEAMYDAYPDTPTTGQAAVSLTNVIEPPRSIVPGGQLVEEDDHLLFAASRSNTIYVLDEEAGSGVIATVSANDGTLTFPQLSGLTIFSGSNGSETITFSGSVADVNIALEGLKYTPTADYSGAASVDVAIRSIDGGRGSTQTETVTITVNPINDAPAGLALANRTSSISEDTDTTAALKVADIEVTDDAIGSNTISLSGTDAASFEVVGGELRLRGGTILNYDLQNTFAVTVNLADSTVSGSTTLTEDFVLAIADVNLTPTDITLANVVPLFSEDVDTSSHIKVADIQVTDDTAGTNTLSLTGADAASFEVIGTELFLVAGTVLDYETQSSYSVTVNAQDNSLSGSTPVTAGYSLALTDVNEAPLAVSLTNAVGALTDDTDTTSAIRVADIEVSDDVLGTNDITLTGSDAVSFEVVGGELRLRAGTLLDSDVQSSYAVTVNVEDSSLSGSTPVTVGLTLAITLPGSGNVTIFAYDDTASLVSNGSFESGLEDTLLTTVGSITGWTNSNLIEVWGDGFVNRIVGDRAGPDNRGHILELDYTDSGSLDWIEQGIATGSGSSYLVLLDVLSRTGAGASDDMEMLFGGVAFDTISTSELAGESWQTRGGLVTGTGGTDAIRITETAASNDGLGPLIDNFRIFGADTPSVDEAMPVGTAVTNIVVNALPGHSYTNFRLSDDAGGRFALDLESGVISTTQTFDYDTDPTSYQLVLAVDTDEGTVIKVLGVSLNDVNEAPMGVVLANAVSSLPENTDTSSSFKLADIQITDDAIGSNTVSLTGADAASFEVVGSELFLPAGTSLDDDVQDTYSVTVNVEDSTVSGSTPVTVDYTLTIDHANHVPSGTVAISGTATEDQVLTASHSLTDGDGLGAISYQWNRSGVAIDGATNATYTLTQEDVGAQITVTASYTDGEGTPESVTSAATSAVVNVDHQPVLSDASPAMAGISEDPGVPIGAVGTLVSDLIDTGGPLDNYTDADGDAPAIAIVGVNLGGGTLYYSIDNGATWADVGAVSEASARLLHADSGTRLAFTPAADFHGTIGDLLTIKAWDRTGGHANGAGGVNTTALTATSIATDTVSIAVTPVNDTPTGSVTITGTATEDETLTASNTLADTEGLGAISYQWNRSDVAIDGATNTTYTLTQEDVGARITVTASYTDGEGTPESVTSDPTSAVVDINDAPTGVVLANATTALPEDTDTTSAVKVADIVITDDGHAGSSNAISLTGADAASFEVVGTELFLKAGELLDYESQTSYTVTVNVEDSTISGSTPVTVNYSLAMTNINEAPTGVTLANAITLLAENADRTNRIKLADIQINGDTLGSNVFSLTGADAADFEIDGTELFLKAGPPLNHAVKNSYAVTVSLVDTSLPGSTPVTANLALDISEHNLPPTSVGVTATTPVVAEDVDTSVPIKVGDIIILDDGVGINTITLSGADADSFEVVGLVLNHRAGFPFDYETQIDYFVMVSVQDTSLPGTIPFTASLLLTLTDVNEAPTSVVLSNVVSSLLDGTDTSSRIKVADFEVSDDALGSNTVSLTGTDAASFEVDGTELFLKAGEVLDYDVQSSYAVTVSVEDITISGSTPVTASLTLSITTVNLAPTDVTLANVVATLAEDTDTTSAIKLADIQITDDPVGTNTVSLTGIDAASFEVVGSSLYLKAGEAFDYETQSSYDVTVSVEDSTVSGSTPVTAMYSLDLTDVNEAPTGAVVANPVSSLAEDTDTTSAIKLADIQITDDALGSNTVSLTGPDAASFEVVGSELFLAAGTSIDHESQDSYSVTLSVEDSSLVGSTPVTVGYSLAITNVNESPSGAVTISGIATEDQVLTASNTLADPEGLGAISLQWNRSGVAIDGATNTTYTLTQEDVGARITVTASYTDGEGTPESVTSDQTLAVVDINDAPTGVALANATASLPEDTNTTSAVKVADIVITDDGHAGSSNGISLTGTDAVSFEVVGTELFLKAGEVLDYESQASYAVTVNVEDSSVSGSTPVTSSLTLAITPPGSGNVTIFAYDDTANLASNGSFDSGLEDTLLTTVDSIAGWTNSNLIEVWGDGFVNRILGERAGPDNRDHILELDYTDSGSLDWIEQGIATGSGSSYLVLLDVLSRTGQGASDDMEMLFGGVVFDTISTSELAGESWQTRGGLVTGTGGTDAIRITETAASNDGLGPLIDNFRIFGADTPSVDEAMPVGTAVTNIVVNALPGHSYTNLRLSDDAGGRFALDLESGVISTTQTFDYETDPTSYQIVLTVDTDEGTVHKYLNVAVNETNQAPTGVSLTNTVSAIAEDADTSSAIRVADIVVSDDGVGTNTLSLTGADAASFEVIGTELFLVAGTILDYETESNHSVTVNAQDSSLSGSTPVTVGYSLALTDTNEAPLAVSLTNAVGALTDDTDTTSAIRVADIVIADDALGTNAITLTGTDAASFEVVGAELRLRAGTLLDSDSQSSYAVTVNVEDSSVSGSTPVTSSLTLAITPPGSGNVTIFAYDDTANLASNGSFDSGLEDTLLTTVDSIAGWTNSNLIEVWGDGFVNRILGERAGPDNRDHILELDYTDSGSLDWIEQGIATGSGSSYLVLLDVLSRTGQGASDDMEMLFGGVVFDTISTSELAGESWQTRGGLVTGTGGTDAIRITETAASNDGLGPLIDNFRIFGADTPSVDEAMPVGTAVTNVVVNALPGHSYTNLRLSDDAGGRFALDLESGVISTTQTFDYETDPTSYQIILTVDTDEGTVHKYLNVDLNNVAEGSAHRSLRQLSEQGGWLSRANVQLDSPRMSLGTGGVLDDTLQSSDLVRLNAADSTAPSSTLVTTDLAMRSGDELDDIFSALEGDWQDLFGDDGENPFSDL